MHIAVYNKCMRLFYLQIISKLSGIKRFCNEHSPKFVSQSYYHIKLGYCTNTLSMILKKHDVFFAGLDNPDEINSGRYNSAPGLF